MVLISALVASAGGAVPDPPEAGRDAPPAIDPPAGPRAADVIDRLAHSKAADPGLATADEEAARTAFQGGRGGFLTNRASLYGAAAQAVASGALGPPGLPHLPPAPLPPVRPPPPGPTPLAGVHL